MIQSLYRLAGYPLRNVPPVRDPKYLAYIRQFPCISCRSTRRRSEAMHTGPHGIGQKASDLDALPGCYLCHRELHAIGPKKWQAKHQVDFRERREFFQHLYRTEFPERFKEAA